MDFYSTFWLHPIQLSSHDNQSWQAYQTILSFFSDFMHLVANRKAELNHILKSSYTYVYPAAIDYLAYADKI